MKTPFNFLSAPLQERPENISIFHNACLPIKMSQKTYFALNNLFCNMDSAQNICQNTVSKEGNMRQFALKTANFSVH